MDLTQGNITRNLIKFSIPIIIMNIIAQAYVIADSVIVSRFLGEGALSIISSAVSATVIGYCILNGLCAGCPVIIGRLFGEKNYDRIKDALCTFRISGCIATLIITIAYILFSKQLFTSLKLPAQLLDESILLTQVYAIGFITHFYSNMQYSTLNGIGDSKSSMVICTVSQIMNVFLDIIVICFFGWGVYGASIASTFSMFVSCVWGHFVISKKLNALSDKKGKFNIEVFKDYMKLSIPSTLQKSVLSIGSLLLQRIVNMHGVDAINAYTISINIQSILVIPVMCYTMGYETFSSQNLGAKLEDRVKEGFTTILKTGFLLCIVLSILTIIFNKPMISLYLKDVNSTSFKLAYTFVLIYTPNYFFVLYKHGIDALFKANMKVHIFTISSILTLCMQIVFAYATVDILGLSALIWGISFGNIIGGLFNTVLKKVYKY